MATSAENRMQLRGEISAELEQRKFVTQGRTNEAGGNKEEVKTHGNLHPNPFLFLPILPYTRAMKSLEPSSKMTIQVA